jgi:hypothetical protein
VGNSGVETSGVRRSGIDQSGVVGTELGKSGLGKYGVGQMAIGELGVELSGKGAGSEKGQRSPLGKGSLEILGGLRLAVERTGPSHQYYSAWSVIKATGCSSSGFC